MKSIKLTIFLSFFIILLFIQSLFANPKDSLAKAGFTEVKQLQTVPKELIGPIGAIAWTNPIDQQIKYLKTPSPIGEITEKKFTIRMSAQPIQEVFSAKKTNSKGELELFTVLSNPNSVLFCTPSKYESPYYKARMVCDMRQSNGNFVFFMK